MAIDDLPEPLPLTDVVDPAEDDTVIQDRADNETEDQASRLPFAYASNNGVFIEDGKLICTTGLSLSTLSELRRYIGKPLELTEISEEEFKKRLTALYQSSDGEAQQAAEDMDAEFDLTALAEDIDDGELLSGEGDAPVIRLINAILSQAVQEKASDIHVEPYEDRVSVRFRTDGVLKEVLSPKPALAPVLVSRLKVMARLDIAEKRIPQDGRITVKLEGTQWTCGFQPCPLPMASVWYCVFWIKPPVRCLCSS